MANTLKRMERDGLIASRPDPRDARASLVSLTPLAVGKLKGVQAAGHAANDIAMGSLSPGEREQYRKLLLKVIGSLEAEG